MAYLTDEALDGGLDYLDTNGTRVDICSQEPTTYTEATSTYTLGNDTVNTGAPANRSPNGREVTIPAISGASVTDTGTATHWALTDGTSELLATGALSSEQGVTSGNTFDLASFVIGIPDAS